MVNMYSTAFLYEKKINTVLNSCSVKFI